MSPIKPNLNGLCHVYKSMLTGFYVKKDFTQLIEKTNSNIILFYISCEIHYFMKLLKHLCRGLCFLKFLIIWLMNINRKLVWMKVCTVIVCAELYWFGCIIKGVALLWGSFISVMLMFYLLVHAHQGDGQTSETESSCMVLCYLSLLSMLFVCLWVIELDITEWVMGNYFLEM